MDQYLEQLRRSRTALREAVDGVPPALRGTRPAPDRWSVSEALAHLSLVERSIAGVLRRIADEVRTLELQREAEEGKPVDPDLTAVLDRSFRVEAIAAFRPGGDLDWAEAWAALETSRAELVAVIEAARDLPLQAASRPHFAIGPLSGIEWIVFTARHEERHASQIRELAGELAREPSPPRNDAGGIAPGGAVH